MKVPVLPIHLYVPGSTPTTLRTACGAWLTSGQHWRATTYRGSATCAQCLSKAARS